MSVPNDQFQSQVVESIRSLIALRTQLQLSLNFIPQSSDSFKSSAISSSKLQVVSSCLALTNAITFLQSTIVPLHKSNANALAHTQAKAKAKFLNIGN